MDVERSRGKSHLFFRTVKGLDREDLRCAVSVFGKDFIWNGLQRCNVVYIYFPIVPYLEDLLGRKTSLLKRRIALLRQLLKSIVLIDNGLLDFRAASRRISCKCSWEECEQQEKTEDQ